ncbi:hypothetical protein WICMUC_002301 [Wickerhamomyces mucosus]|uniref:Probable electron transfer flavoprotein subunit alpha n=1 Tax=Wickerhamomyces mucosus TaxID=1378264 RepID=A0A9P8PR19_9ASCO|nr:hypothetical protein WICMUC_002301 [Wickerhamomyces mucosus]
MLRSLGVKPSLLKNQRLASARFGSTLAFIESSNDKISSSTLSTLNAAKELGNPIVAVSFNSKLQSELNKVPGLSKILLLENEKFSKNSPEILSPILAKLIQDQNLDVSHFVIPSTAVGKNILPRVGALLDIQPISDVIKIESASVFQKPIYAGNIIQTVESPADSKVLLSVRPSAYEAVELTSDSTYESQKLESDEINELNIKWVSENLTVSERPELTSAKKIVSGGRALKNKETFDKLIYPLADALNAGVGATRAAVDAGFCDNSLQIGQTGKIVSPDLYIALGISGAIQHLAGMKDSKVIVAINKDEDSPIFNIADVGLIGDLYEIVPELTEKLKN